MSGLPRQRLVILSVVFTMALGLSLTLSLAVLPLYAIALAVMACAAVPYLLHTHPHYTFSWVRLVLPAAIALAAPFVAQLLGAGPFRLVGVFGPGILLYGVIYAEYVVVRPVETVQAQAGRLLLTLTAYGVGLAFFLVIYQIKERSLISGTIAAAVSAALALRLLTIDRPRTRKVDLCALFAGVAVAEVLWPLNYWVLNTVAGGLALLLTFYVVSGVLRQLVARSLTAVLVREYTAVGLIGVVVIFGASRM